SKAGHVIEVGLTKDLLLILTDGHVDTILNTSTGGGYTYTSQGVSAVAATPPGRFTITRQVDGLDISPLGQLWRPKYFSGGFAVHGYPEVPPVPVSHGCVRVSMAAMDWIWAQNLMPIGTQVWIY
ncbi:MAG TPA: L,D-transpeptidase, partial [Mycobacterium sp.]|nr:L,D-transpeptidase [Mycobacterium sp.]